MVVSKRGNQIYNYKYMAIGILKKQLTDMVDSKIITKFIYEEVREEESSKQFHFLLYGCGDGTKVLLHNTKQEAYKIRSVRYALNFAKRCGIQDVVFKMIDNEYMYPW